MVLQKIVATRAPAAVILIRLAVGAVFLSEGIQKFLFPGELGAGRFAKIGLLIAIMLVALATTKVPILVNRGFWAMAHEARTDWSMLLGSIFLLTAGAGPWSLDRLLATRSAPRK